MERLIKWLWLAGSILLLAACADSDNQPTVMVGAENGDEPAPRATATAAAAATPTAVVLPTRVFELPQAPPEGTVEVRFVGTPTPMAT